MKNLNQYQICYHYKDDKIIHEEIVWARSKESAKEKFTKASKDCIITEIK